MHLVQVASRPGFPEPPAREVHAELRQAGLAGIEEVRLVTCYLLSEDIDLEGAELIARRLLADPVTHDVSVDAPPPIPGGAAHTVLVLRKPGVMDPVALSLAGAVEDLGLTRPQVRIGRRYDVYGSVDGATLLSEARRVVANETIEEIFLDTPFPRRFAEGAPYRFAPCSVSLTDLDDESLMAISRRRVLSLNITEMRVVRDFFEGLSRDPTDVELETLAQTWSEHCKHKTFNGTVLFEGERIENLLKATVMEATRKICEEGGRDDCLSVFKDNAGVIRFDETRAICMKVETHNHPSAIEPYGGAGTGIGGVIRDIMGTGLGATPILNTDVFCFGPPDLPAERLPAGTLHPRRIMKGVVSGVRDYGNRMGIPTANGALYFDERYVGNPLVFCGTVGVLPVSMVEKAPRPGDLVLLAGGRTGRDGIHGVTFASVELTEESEMMDAGAVQIGNPIEEKKLLDAQLRARDLGLYTAVTDCGGGGLSSAVGEMGEATGVRVDLDRVPLKYSGLSPLEIWISEAQERMIFSVPPEHRERILEVFAEEHSEAVFIGEFTDDRKLTLLYEGQVVADLPMDFLHDGLPKIEREAVFEPPVTGEPARPARPDYGARVRRILSSPNVCSKEWVIRQYDHEVQGLTAVKPLVGVREEGPGDAVVFGVEQGETRGVVVSCGMNPRYGDLDPYAMAAAGIDEAVRNSLAVGAKLERIALLDNFSWGNTDKPDRLGALVLASRALHDVAVAYGTPFISGKDSLNNEYQTDAGTIVIPHTLLISAISVIDDMTRAVTMDLKRAGSVLYLLGETRDELGGSHYLLLDGEKGTNVPQVRPEEAKRTFRALQAAMDAGLVLSCHDLSEGGLAVAAAEMALAGELGASLALAGIPRHEECVRDDALLFSESQSRFLVEVAPADTGRFDELFSGIPAAAVGGVREERRLRIEGLNGELVVDEPVEALREAFLATLRDF